MLGIGFVISLWHSLSLPNFGFRKKRDYIIYVAKIKAMISCVVIAQLICVFIFACMQKAGFLMTRLKSSSFDIFNQCQNVTFLTSNIFDIVIRIGKFSKRYINIIVTAHKSLSNASYTVLSRCVLYGL